MTGLLDLRLRETTLTDSGFSRMSAQVAELKPSHAGARVLGLGQALVSSLAAKLKCACRQLALIIRVLSEIVQFSRLARCRD